MEEKTISVLPFSVSDNLIKIDVTLSIDNISETFTTNGSYKINLYNRELENGGTLKPREVSGKIHLKLEPKWISLDSRDRLTYLVGKEENPVSVLGFRRVP